MLKISNNKYQITNKNTQRGFTLIELMVAIAIIAILSTVGLVIFLRSQQTARDGKRKADIDGISTSLETRYNTTVNQNCTATVNSYCAPQGSWFSSGSVPLDPVNATSGGKNYFYTDNGNTITLTNGNANLPANGDATYTLCALMENTGTGNAVDTSGGQGAGSKDYYCKKNQQQ